MKQKVCAILILIMLLLNSSVMVVIAESIEAVNELVDSTIQNITKVSNIDLRLNAEYLVNNVENKVELTATLKTDDTKYSLFKNPSISIEMPAEIVDVILEEPYLMYNNQGFTIVSYEITTTENGNKVINVQLEGEQTEYETNSILEGTNVVIPARLVVSKQIDTTIANMKLRYTNENECHTIYEADGYDCETQEIFLINKIVKNLPANTNEEEAKTLEFEQDGIKVEIIEKVGNTVIPNNGTLYEQQVVKHVVRFTNVSEVVQPVNFVITIPEELTYLEFYPQEIIHNEEYDAYYINRKPVYIYDLDKKQINLSTEQLEVGETIETYVEFRVENLQDVLEQIISIDYDFIKNDGTISEYNISNTINEAEIETFLDCVRLNDRADWQYSLSVTNTTDRTLTNVNILAEIDKGFNISEIYRFVLETGEHEFFDLSNVQENTFIYPIDKIEPGECYKIMVDGNTKDIYENEEKNTFEMKGVFKVYGEEINTYVSNETSVTAGIEKVKVSMTSDKDGQELKTDDEITYTINIQNIGNERLAMSKYSNVKLTNFIPEEFQPISATYNNFVIQTQYVEEIRDYVSAPLKVETYSEVQKNVDLTYKEVPDGMSNEEVPNLELYLSIPYGKTITVEVKAKVKMVLEKADITNEVTVEGKDMLTKIAGATNTLLPYNYDETQEPQEPENPEDIGGGTITDPDQPETPENPDENIDVKVTGVELIPTEATLKVGQSVQLIAEVLPNDASNKAVTWSSSDESVAVVVNGNVIALKEGTATITVTTEDGNKTATSIITVENVNTGDSEVPVTGIQMTPKASTILIGKTVKLRIAIIPSNATNQKVVWSSSDEQIATVDENGLVTGIKEGKAIITVTTEDENKTATCEITVQNVDGETEPTDPEEPQEPQDPTNPEVPEDPEKPTDPEEPQDPQEPTDPEIPQNPEKPEEEKMTVSGTAWIDINENGKRDAEEPLYSNMTVMLYNYKTKKLVSVNGIVIEKKTDGNGNYEFTDLEKGQYIVIFWYDTNKYELTKYQKTGVSNSENSDVVSKNVSLMGEKKLAGITDIITVNKNVSNIDIGLIETKEFDFSIQKYINKITIQTNKGTKTYTYNSKSFAKVEIHSKEINGAQVIIEYKMVVKNEGELPGRVDLIVDNVPNDLNFYSELNPNWYKNKDGICTTALSGETIAVGESKEISIVLTKNINGNNVGVIENTATIGLTSNEKAIEEENLENNSAKAEVLITISTGLIKWIGFIIGISVVLGIMVYIIIKDKKLIKTITFVFLIGIFILGNSGQVFAAIMSQQEANEEWSSDTSAYPVKMPDGSTKTLRCVTPQGTMCGTGAAYHKATFLRQTEIAGTRTTTSTGNTNIPTDVEFTLSDGTTQKNVGVTTTSTSIKIGPFRVNALRGTTSASDVTISSCKVIYDVMDSNGTVTANQEKDITTVAKLGQDFYIELPLGTTQIKKININAGCSYSATTSSTVKYRFYYKITAIDGYHRYGCMKATNTPDKWNYMQTLAEDKVVTENTSINKSCQKSLEINGPWTVPGNLYIQKLISGTTTFIPNVGVKIVQGSDTGASKYLALYDSNGVRVTSVNLGDILQFNNYKAYTNFNYTNANGTVFTDLHSTVTINNVTYTAKWQDTKANGTELILTTGKVTLKNMRASGAYKVVETSNPNFGYSTAMNLSITGTITNLKPLNYSNTITMYNTKATGSIVIKKVDEDSNSVLSNVQFVIKAKQDSTEKGYIKIIADDSSNVTKFANSDYAQTVTGYAKIKEGVTSPIVYVSNIADATKFITDANGKVTIANLSATTFDENNKPHTNTTKWYYKAEEYSNPNYGYSKSNYHSYGLTKYIAADTSDWAVNTSTGWKLLPLASSENINNSSYVYGTAYQMTVSNKKITGNICINKYDYESKDVIQNIGFVLKADLVNNSTDTLGMDEKYIKVKISHGSKTNDSSGYANYTQGNVRIADGTTSIKYVSNPKDATIFYTDSNGQIIIANLLQSTNGNDSIRYKIEEIDSKAYGYGAEIGEKYVTLTKRSSSVTASNTPTSAQYELVEILNYKQTGNLEIIKKDNEQNINLQGVTFVLKAKVKQNGTFVEKYVKAVLEGSNVIISSTGYATEATGTSRVKDITNSINGTNEISSIKFVDNISEATKFTTDSNGKIKIINLLTSTNGVDKISYYMQEIENDNYGYTGVSNQYNVVYETEDGWIEIDRQESDDTKELSSSKLTSTTIKNIKQTMNLKIDKYDIDTNEKLERVTFVLKANLSDGKISNKYIRIIPDDGSNTYALNVTGSVRVADKLYTNNDKLPCVEFISNIEDATHFTTDENGQIMIMNLIMSTDGENRIQYTPIEIANDHYGYVADGSNAGVRFENETRTQAYKEMRYSFNRQTSIETSANVNESISKANMKVKNIKQTGNLQVIKGDYEQFDNVKLGKVTFLIKAHLPGNNDVDGKYIKIMPDGSTTYADIVEGTVRIRDQIYNKETEQSLRPLLFVEKNNGTKFVTDAQGKIKIINLLISLNGTELIKYSFEEIANENYGYIADGTNITLRHEGQDLNTNQNVQYTIPIQTSIETQGGSNNEENAIKLKNIKQTGNLQINKVDFDDGSTLTEEVTFVVKAHLDGNNSINGKYIKIIADPNIYTENVINKKDGYVETAKGIVRIKDQSYNYENIKESVKYVDSYSEATKFVTNNMGQVTIMNLIMSTNATDRIEYTFEELKNENYGYVAEEGYNNNLTLRYSEQDINTKEEVKQKIERQSSIETSEKAEKVQQITIKNIKQTGNLVITKVDSRNPNETLANVEFALKVKIVQKNANDKNNETNIYANIDDKYVNATTQNLENGAVKITDISFVDTIQNATKFKTDEQGKLMIYNLLMSTNGADRITYHLVETKNPNYGYLADTDNFADFNVSFEGTSVNGDYVTIERQTKQQTDGKTSGNNTTVTVKNEQIYTRLSGIVWEDIISGKANTKTDSLYKEASDDALIEGIKVYLYKDGELVTTTTTDKNGYYMFGTLKEGGYNNSDYWGNKEPEITVKNNKEAINSKGENENGNIVIADVSKYHIEFEYDGLRFTTVQPFAKDGETDVEAINSKGKEIASRHKDNKDRETVDKSFTTVYGGSNEGNVINGAAGITNKPETKTYDLQYNPIISDINGNRSEYIDHWEYSGYETNENGKKYIKAINTYGHYPIVSNVNEIKWDDKYVTDDTIPYINQGLYRRELPDLSINSDISKVEIIVDGYKNTYKYGKRGISDIIDGEESDGYGVEVKYGTSMGSYSSRGLNTYTRPLYASDLAYNLANSGNNELMQVFITYHISVKNGSDTLKARINEIANYYDSRYERVAAEGATIIKDEQTNDVAFKKLTLNVDQTMNPGTIYDDIYITFKLNKEAVLEIANERATLHNITEITSFTTFYGQGTYYAEYQEYQSSGDNDRKVYAGIDKDSAPGSSKVFVADRIEGTTMIDINGDGTEYEYSTPILEISSEAIKTFEDDTTIAPSLILEINSAEPTRGLSGVIFEDNADFSSCTNAEHHATGIHTNETRLGNGIYDEGENLIKNAKVELYNVDETTGEPKSEVATLYRLEIHDGRAQVITLEGTTWSGDLDENRKYNYRFMGVTTGKYLIRYSYGKLEQTSQIIKADGTVKDLSAIEYKSTIITSDEIKQALNLFANPDRLGNLNWILIEEKDNQDNVIRYSDATDDVSLRNPDDEEVYYTKEEDTKIMTADTAVFDIGIEFKELTNGEQYKESITEYDDEFILIDENQDGTYDKIVRNPQFYAINPYQDFGVIERAIPDAYIHKTVSHMRLVSGQGQELINGKPFEDSLKYVKALEWNKGLKEDNERTISIEVDNEIYPANLYLEYAITAYNNSELDYKYNDDIGKKFYFFGIVEDEYGNKATPIDETIAKVVDYMDADLKFDIEKSNNATINGEWSVLTLAQLLGDEDYDNNKKFISPEVEEVLKKNGYTILVTTAFKGLKAGENKTIYAYAEKLVAADADELIFDNHVEIIHTRGLRTIENATPGNYIPSTKSYENEQDDDWIKVVMAPPTGLPLSKIYQ